MAMTRLGKIGLVVGLVALVLGLALSVGSAVVAGDWWLAREPWIGIGLNLIVGGLAVTAISVLVLEAIEPLGWLRLVAVPPGLLLAAMWTYYLVLGEPTSGLGGSVHDIGTIIYSNPIVLFLLLGLTVLLALPLLIYAAWRTGEDLA